MKRHPLSRITSHIVCTGNLVVSDAVTIDAKGNPTYNKIPVTLDLVVLMKRDQQYYRNLYTVDGARKIADVYIQKAWINNVEVKTIDLLKLEDQLFSTNKLTKLTIVDRTQKNLKPITKAFGIKLTTIIDGAMVV